MPGRTALKLRALAHVVWGKTARAFGLREDRDGWRRIVGVGLREEHAKFAVAAFGLKRPDHVLESFADFLHTEPEARFVLDAADHLTYRKPTTFADVVELVYDGGKITSLTPRFDPAAGVERDIETAVTAVASTANETANRPEPMRPGELLGLVRRTTDGNTDAFRTASRIVAASCVTVEPVSDAERFAPPALAVRRGLGYGHLTFVVRPFGDACDVWAYAHHTGTDGVPLQELVARLTQSFGTAGPVAFPEPDGEAVVRGCHVPGERAVYESLSFHEFGPLLALRKRLNAAKPEAEVTFGGLLMWLLSLEREMKGVKFGSTVDVAAKDRHDRCVGMVSLAPGEFASVQRFATAYESALRDCRERRGPTHAAIETAKQLPAWLHRAMLVSFPEVTDATFGSVGAVDPRDPAVFVAPYADLGFPGGFVAVGNVNLPTASGRRVGCVSVKGDRETVERVPTVLRRMLVNVAKELTVKAA